jgi:NAD(P)-dependent dehydrogenase (short-subunit alcohol dehydrogenase family)
MKRHLITGASRGIGRAIAQKLASKETSLLLHGRDREALAETCRMVENLGGIAQPLAFDLREPAQIGALIEAVGTEPLDGLINNAGIAVVKPLEAISLEEWQSMLAINVTAPFLLTKAFAANMRSGASIVNVLSIAAKTGFPNWSSYCTTKFALEGFSQAVREELRPRGIRVINLYPAATNTDIWDSVEGDWPRGKMMLPTEIGDAVAYALSRPPDVALENINLMNVSGRL